MADLEKRNVLLVEDEVPVAETMAELLEALMSDTSVKIVSTLKEALDVSDGDYSLIVVDGNFPNGDLSSEELDSLPKEKLQGQRLI
ncbi:hypothetical protein K9L63_02885 [Candidatus Gracilibacteria bacterium]|nr:hypothetical protein [Candidatus Gracilibacteria bacterium]